MHYKYRSSLLGQNFTCTSKEEFSKNVLTDVKYQIYAYITVPTFETPGYIPVRVI